MSMYKTHAMTISEKPCHCHKLTLPRWDIYICPKCDRQLAFIESIQDPHLSFIERLTNKFTKWIKK